MNFPGNRHTPRPRGTVKQHSFFQKLSRRRSAYTPPEGHKPAMWNGQPCTAQAGTCTVPPAEKGTYWYANLTGDRIKCVVVHYSGREGHNDKPEQFVLSDHDGSASRKVFESWGGPDSRHYSLPDECLATFTPDP